MKISSPEQLAVNEQPFSDELARLLGQSAVETHILEVTKLTTVILNKYEGVSAGYSQRSNQCQQSQQSQQSYSSFSSQQSTRCSHGCHTP